MKKFVIVLLPIILLLAIMGVIREKDLKLSGAIQGIEELEFHPLNFDRFQEVWDIDWEKPDIDFKNLSIEDIGTIFTSVFSLAWEMIKVPWHIIRAVGGVAINAFDNVRIAFKYISTYIFG